MQRERSRPGVVVGVCEGAGEVVDLVNLSEGLLQLLQVLLQHSLASSDGGAGSTAKILGAKQFPRHAYQ